MKIHRKILMQYLRIANQIVEPRQMGRVLACIRLELHRGTTPTVQINATDLEVHLEAELPVTLDPFDPSDDQTVAACVPLRVLLNAIRTLPKAQTEVEINLPTDPQKSAARIEGMTLVCQSAEDFPPCPDSSLEFRRFDYKQLAHIMGAVSHDENRYALNGVLLNFEKGVVVSTDGHRLHMNQCMPPEKDGPVVILPRKAASIACSASPQPAISITPPTGQVLVTIPLKEGRIVARTIDGQFPNYEAVVPKSTGMQGRLTIDPTVLKDALLASMTISEERNRPVSLDLNGAITLKASSQENGSFERVLPGTYTGKPIVVGFNGNYILDAVDALGGVTPITLSFKDGTTPMVTTKGTVTAVVMPMKL